MAEEVDRPIFIVGPHRSGTTLLYRTLAKHPNVGFYNRADRRWRASPRVAHLMTKFASIDRPVEAQKIWDRFWNGRDDVMSEADATQDAIAWYRNSVSTILRLRGVNRFLSKYPRLSLRMGWIDAVFPGALYIHIVRDWRAVVNSTMGRRAKRQTTSGRWYGMRIPGAEDMAELPPELVAGRQYRITTQAIRARDAITGSRLVRVHYGELCREPEKTIRRIADHCDLGWDSGFVESLPKQLKSVVRWRHELDPDIVSRIRAEDPDFYTAHEEDG